MTTIERFKINRSFYPWAMCAGMAAGIIAASFRRQDDPISIFFGVAIEMAIAELNLQLANWCLRRLKKQ